MSACAPVSLEEPTTGPIAQVRFTANTKDSSVLRQYDNVGCTANEREVTRLRTGVLVNSIPHRLGIAGADQFPKNAAQELRVQANRPSYYLYTASVLDGRRVKSCGVPFTLNPRNGQQLEASFEVTPSNTCKVTVNEILGGDPTSAKRRTVKVVTNKVTPETQSCRAAFEKERLY